VPRAFVVGARIATGGAFMAYHLGRILHHHFGFELYDVEVMPVPKALFDYDTPMMGVTVSAMEQMVTKDDILIVNPSFSTFMFGFRLPCKKVMYIQDFKTFTILDAFCDSYACVSSVVRHFVTHTWGVYGPIIPPFIQLSKMKNITPWGQRPKDSVMVYLKHNSQEHQIIFNAMRDAMLELRPGFDLRNFLLQGRKFTHADFLAEMGKVRYVVVISIAEGFGLVPLEAMGMGACVLGLDGLAGRDYMKGEHNCLSVAFTHAHRLAEMLDFALNNPALCKKISTQGRATAQEYGYPRFRDAWIQRFSKLLQREPTHGA